MMRTVHCICSTASSVAHGRLSPVEESKIRETKKMSTGKSATVDRQTVSARMVMIMANGSRSLVLE